MAGQTMFTRQKQTLSLLLKNAGGTQVTTPDAVPAWSVDSPSLLSVVPAANGMSAVATALGPEGTAVVTVTVDGVTGAYAFTLQNNTVATVAVQQFGLPSPA